MKILMWFFTILYNFPRRTVNKAIYIVKQPPPKKFPWQRTFSKKGSKYEIAILTILGWRQFWQPHNAPESGKSGKKPEKVYKTPGKGPNFVGRLFRGVVGGAKPRERVKNP